MGKIFLNLSIFIIVLTILSACTKEVSNEFDLDQLTRIDFEVYTVEKSINEVIITEEKVHVLREVFAKIEWEQNIKAEMARKEDAKTTLFLKYDENLPERLFVYLIWFNQGDGAATIIDTEKNALGTLKKEDTQLLNDILLNN